jgi:hypothetical protein
MRVPYTPNVKQYNIIGRGGTNFDVIFKAPSRRHTGRGFGAIASFVGRTVLPFLKRIILPRAKATAKKYILPAAKTALKSTVSDIVKGENVKNSVKKRALEAGERVFRGLTNNTTDVAKKRKQTRPMKITGHREKRRKKPTRTLDIFS